MSPTFSQTRSFHIEDDALHTLENESSPHERMPLKGIPTSISPELLYALAKMGHGDRIVIADSNFPSDSTAASTMHPIPIRVSGSTADVLRDILTLIPLDLYAGDPVCVMDRVQSDKDRDLLVPAYEKLQGVVDIEAASTVYNGCKFELSYVNRFEFYVQAKSAFCVVQTTDSTAYANVMISKGVL